MHAASTVSPSGPHPAPLLLANWLARRTSRKSTRHGTRATDPTSKHHNRLLQRAYIRTRCRLTPMCKTRPDWRHHPSAGGRIGARWPHAGARGGRVATAEWPRSLGSCSTQHNRVPNTASHPPSRRRAAPLSQPVASTASSGERARPDAASVVEVVRRLVEVELGALLHVVRIATTEGRPGLQVASEAPEGQTSLSNTC